MSILRSDRLFVKSTGRYRADIDGLRCVAVLAVVCFHAFQPRLPGGFVGVDIFFVISGYLITGILLRAPSDPRLALGDFYRRRLKRIFPSLVVVLVATLAAGWIILLAPDYANLGKEAAASAAFVANLQFWSEASYFDTSSTTKPLLHLWSLGVEEQFYIIWPALILALRRVRRGLGPLIVMIGFASFAYSCIAVENSPVAAFFSPLSRFWELLAGGWLAEAEHRGLRPRGWLWMPGAVLIGASFVLLNFQSSFPGLLALPAVAGTFLVIASGPDGKLNGTLLSFRPLVAIGLFSYPLYLWHWPLLSFALIANFEQALSGLVRLGLVMAAMILAWATWRFIERPPRLRKYYTPGILLGIMTVVLAASLSVFLFRGLPDRAINHDDRRQFVAQYQRLHGSAFTARNYRFECDFVVPGTLSERQSIDQSCTARSVDPYVLLWGDSHAQALSLGLSQIFPALRQVATSGCRPDDHFDKTHYPNEDLKRACDASNRFALATITRERPDLLIIAQGQDHLDQQWDTFAGRLKQLGAKRVVLVGPLPQWSPSLPLVVAAKHWPYDGERVAEGLDLAILSADGALRRQSQRWSNLDYVSLIARLCDRRGCIAQAPDGGLTAMDYGHLTASGSLMIGGVIRPKLQHASGQAPGG